MHKRYGNIPEGRVDISRLRSGQLNAMKSIEHKSDEGPITPYDQGISQTGSTKSIRRDPFFHIGKQYNQRVNEAKTLKHFAS
jgi:hypothetical protein